MSDLEVEWLGEVPYAEALELQQAAIAARRSGTRGDRLLLLEHPPVVTRGSAARPESLRVSERELARRGIDLFSARRGGDFTYHAPGQLVGYPIVDLAARHAPDVDRFLRQIESALMDALAVLSVPTRRIQGMTGVFVENETGGRPRKIASIGIGLRQWVTWHGFALNVSLDLAGFDVIVPCGLHEVEMTSIAREAGADSADPERVRTAIVDAFQQVLSDRAPSD
jgi:lipoyl(octanoyl) transferase